jgi:hypothetical protein
MKGREIQGTIQKGQLFRLNFMFYRATTSSKPEGGAVNHIESVWATDVSGREIQIFFERNQVLVVEKAFWPKPSVSR